MSKHEITIDEIAKNTKKVVIRVCAIWIYKSGIDETRARFWSQILNCSESRISSLIQMTVTLDNKLGGIKPNDYILNAMWDVMKDMSPSECKNVFNDLRM